MRKTCFGCSFLLLHLMFNKDLSVSFYILQRDWNNNRRTKISCVITIFGCIISYRYFYIRNDNNTSFTKPSKLLALTYKFINQCSFTYIVLIFNSEIVRKTVVAISLILFTSLARFRFAASNLEKICFDSCTRSNISCNTPRPYS